MLKEIKDERITVRFTPEERMKIELAAMSKGMNLSEFIRYAVFKEVK